jgi:hypothetical protein
MPGHETPASLLREAQRLLDESGPLTSEVLPEVAACLESEDVTVLVHATPSEAMPGADRRTVDVVLTVRPLTGRISGAAVQLEHPSGLVLRGQLNHRGQAAFRGVAAGPWRARLIEDTHAGDTGPRPVLAGELLPLHRISRRLPAAAGSGRRPIRQVYATENGEILTEVLETEETRLVVTITALGSGRPIPVVRLRWTSLVPEDVRAAQTLLTPLAQSRSGPGLLAKYEIGSVEHLEEIEIAPAEWADPSEVTDEAVRQAFELSLYGSAHRAWEQLAEAGVCTPLAQAELRRMLGR